jgi:hypothetical protein
MINRALLGYVRDEYGAETVEAVRAQAECEEIQFSSMTEYADEISYRLVAAAAEILGQPTDAFLEKFGEYWIGFALRSDYGELLRIAGHTLPELLQNLNNLHVRVGQAFPDLKAPSFWCDQVTESSLVLHYASDRVGLGPMVIGLVRGLGRMLGVEAAVAAIATEPGESLKFAVRFKFMGDRVTGESRAKRPTADEDAA